MKLKGQVAIVTGAGRNIGKAIAKLFASEGAKIAVIEMHEGRGQTVVDEVNQSGQEAMLVQCDVSQSRDVQDMVKKVVARFGGIDILINNAALTDHANIFDSTEEEFDKVIAVSLKGPYLVTKHVAAQMAEQRRGGKIVNFGSTSGMIGRADGIAYAAAKAGVIKKTSAVATRIQVTSAALYFPSSTLGARLGNECPELRVRHDIDPRKRRMPVRPQVNDEFLSVLGKAAEPVKIF